MTRPFFLAGEPTHGAAEIAVVDKYRGGEFARVGRAGPEEIERSLSAAAAAFNQTRRLPACDREAVLLALADGLARRRADFVSTLIAEAGKPRKYAEIEVERTINTFRESARRACEVTGELVALDLSPRGRGYRGLWRRFPLGPIACITPFNFPLNLVAHKIGPAIAAGCPFVLKPASATPVSALLVGELLARTDWPKPAWSILPAAAADAQQLAEDERIAVLSFTGSAAIGWDLRARARRKRVVLELGGNAAAIVHDDADLADAARRCAAGGFAQAGQSCISVQRILVARGAYDAFKRALLDATGGLKVGDPDAPETDVGPMITEQDARRVEQWIAGAVARGARLLCGGQRAGAVVAPAILEDVPPGEKVWCEEVFGPVVAIAPYDSFEEALTRANDSRFGLQAGVFTRDIQRVWHAFEALEVGGVIVNDAPTLRFENMPYGGAKASGAGREGPRFTIEDYTEIRMLVIRDV